MRIEAIADIHVGQESEGFYKEHFRDIDQRADLLLIAGDLTQSGTIEEAEQLRGILSVVTIPCVCVVGNHDCQNNQQHEIIQILSTNNIFVLQGTGKVINGIGIAGVKGFIGGFGERTLPSFGEQILKDVVQHGIDEALQLEHALSELGTEKKIVLMHYSPIKATVVGEDPEIFPFLGSSRFEEVIRRMKASVVFHGHAHAGTHSGAIDTGEDGGKIPVFNVAGPLLERENIEHFVFEV